MHDSEIYRFRVKVAYVDYTQQNWRNVGAT